MRTHTTRLGLPRLPAIVAGALLVVVVGGCENGSPMAPTASFSRNAAPSHAISVLTWNMYVGTDVDAALAALQTPDPNDDQAAIVAAIQMLQQTDVQARAAAIADQVAKVRPHVLGFEEVSEIHVNLGPGLTVNLDFLPILETALAQRGLNYDVAEVGTGIQISLLGGAIQLADHDVLFVDHDRVSLLSSEHHAFGVQLADLSPLPAGIDLTRGWVQARVEVKGVEYTIVDTHPESDQGETSLDGLRVYQVGELASSLGTTSGPVIVMGDFNGRPGSDSYGVMTSAGFTDAWHAMRPGAHGYTCCHLPDLSDKVGELDHRIDYIFTRGLGRTGPGLQGSIARLGDVPSDRVQGPDYPIWPSDHAGLVSRFLSTPVAGG